MTTTERTMALCGDEAAEQRSAPYPEAGVVGDLVEACSWAEKALERYDTALGLQVDEAALIALFKCKDALAKYATHQPAISTDRSGPFSQAKIPGDTTADGAADHEGAGR